jgi:hypothetical protein
MRTKKIEYHFSNVHRIQIQYVPKVMVWFQNAIRTSIKRNKVHILNITKIKEQLK